MLVGPLLTILTLAVLAGVLRVATRPGRDDRMRTLLLVGFLARLGVHGFSRNLALFSHGGGGDYMTYEYRAKQILAYWSLYGFEFVSGDDLEGIGPTSLPPNLFAAVYALNGEEPTSLGCTALIAGMACVMCLNIYLLAVELGADPQRSTILTAALLFSPAFLLYTSDMYKDGIVLFFAVGALASGVRLSRKFTVLHLVLGLMCLWALWYVRFYLVFVTSAPLFVGLAGIGARSSARPFFAILLFGAVLAVLAGSTDVLDDVTAKADATFQHGTSTVVRSSNASSGSGVTFDDGGNPWAAMGPKLAYMIFSPFPWAGGSVGFQIGKIDTFFWYYILYRAWLAVRRLWSRERTTVLMFMTFLVPTVVMYATSFSNVGLSLRQRLIVVVIAAVLAMMSWPARQTVHQSSPQRTARRRAPGLVVAPRRAW